jgi:RNA polymerase sigma-70 factor (sigma-E family)
MDCPGAEVEAEVAVERPRSTARMAQLYAEHAPRAGRLAYLLTADRELAQDLAQEAFARLIIRFPMVRRADAVDAYLRRTVINLARKHWRRLGRERAYVRREGPVLLRRTIEEPDLSERDALWRGLDRLPYRQRAALVLRFFEDLSERQTAEALGCAVGTVKSLVSRGLNSLREEMRDGEDG